MSDFWLNINNKAFKIISCNDGSGYHRSSLTRHKKRYHSGQGTQTSIMAHVINSKSRAENKSDLKTWNAEFIAEANLPKNSLESPPFKNWMKRLAQKYNVPQMATEVPMSARTIGRRMDELTDEALALIKSKGSALAKEGRIAFQSDHVTLTKATGEITNSFLAIIITVRNSNQEMIPFPICFEPAKLKTFSSFRRDLKRNLKVSVC